VKESTIQSEVMLEASDQGCKVFRNNVGIATFADGSKVSYGLCVGSSDLIGWRAVTITPDMVGQQVAVFTALEVKTKTGRVTPAQTNFINQVLKAGGYAGVVRNKHEVRNVFATGDTGAQENHNTERTHEPANKGAT
jgi:hypothetical protein